ncbi:MAG: rhodanese-like domain-containing protein [Pseudomonadota bacterium]
MSQAIRDNTSTFRPSTPLGRPPAATLWVLLSVLLTACAGDGNGRVAPEKLLAAIRDGTGPTIVDVRSEEEYVAGHVPGAIHIPFYSVWSGHSRIESGEHGPVVVYCEHGPRAGLAKFGFWTVGYDQILYLDGHMAGWKKRGLPMEKGSAE